MTYFITTERPIRAQFPIEVSERPWFGPTRRAKEHLAGRRSVLSPKSAAQEIVAILGDASLMIQHARFIDFTHTEHGNFRYTIVLIWTVSNAPMRQMLYDLASLMVQRTGWYPLPQGERMRSRSTQEIEWSEVKDVGVPNITLKAPFESIQSAVDTDGGCSIRLKCATGSILLDAGLPGHLQTKQNDQVVLLSHLHSDHLGGIECGAIGHLPTIMSRGTLQILLAQGRMSTAEVGKSRFVLDTDRGWVPLCEGIEILAFTVPHAPGSVGYAIRNAEQALLYTGDIALKSRRHDFRPQLLQLVEGLDRQRKWLLLDATMAGRTARASMTDVARDFFERTRPYRDVFIVSRDSEQLLYAYLDLCYQAKNQNSLRYRTHFIAPVRLRELFQVLHSSFIGRELQRLDPFILLQYGASMSSWAESRWLYWRTASAELPIPREREQRIWLTTTSDMVPSLPPEFSGAVGIGRVSALDAAEMSGATPVYLDTSPWTLHSDMASLKEFVIDISQKTKVVLFHNYPSRLRKFAKSLGPECALTLGDELSLVAFD